MLTHPTLDQLRALKLDGMAEAFVELEAQERASDLDPRRMAGAAARPRGGRAASTRRFQTRLRAARLRHSQASDRGRRLPRVAPARQSAVPAAGHLPLDRRAPHLARHRAVRRRQVVAVLRAGAESLPRRLHRPLRPRAAAVRRSRARPWRRPLRAGCSARWSRSICSILDDWGPDRLSASQRRDLMEIVEDRYGRGSTLITSQLPVDTWHEVIGEPTFADAILDRIVHNAYRLALDGPSMRNPQTAASAEPSEGLPMKKDETGRSAVPEAKSVKAARKSTPHLTTDKNTEIS